MGFFDAVTKPFKDAAHAVGDAAGTVAHAAGDAAKTVTHAAGDAAKTVAHAAGDAASSVADAKGWAGLAWRLNPITGPILQGVDTVKAVKNLAEHKPGASIWDIPTLGFAKGFGQGAFDAVKGIAYLGETAIKSNPLTNPTGFIDQWKKNIHTADVIVHHPGDVLKAIAQPYIDAIKDGHPYEAEGRGAFEVLSLVFGPKGADALLDGVRGAGKGAEAVSEIEKGAEAASATGKGATAVEDAGRAGEEVASAAAKADRVAAAEKLIGDLTPEERALAERVDLNHIFHGDAEGGVHWAPGEGKVPGSDATVEAVKPPKPNATWRGKVTVDGVTKESTLFPREFTPRDVLAAIKEGLKDANPVTSSSNEAVKIYSGTYKGIDVRVLVDTETNTVITAYPKKVGQVFTP